MLSSLFAESAIARKIASTRSDPELANLHFDKMASIYTELKSRGIEAQRALLPLLHHSEPDVRCSAAAVALEFAPALAEPVLESIKELHGFVGYDAWSILRQWRSGTLRFPPYVETDADE
jgi:hypothetical protein